MPDDGKHGANEPPGLAGGPGPTPPGVDDRTPHLDAPASGGAEREEREGQPARGAGASGGAPRADPEEPDPS